MKMKGKKRKINQDENDSMVEIIFKDDWFETAPRCCHGPMLLFERFLKSKKIESFYACSAGRDKDQCKSYKQIASDKQKWKDKDTLSMESIRHKKHNIAEKVLSLLPSERRFCFDCQEFVFCSNELKHHDHKTKINIPDVEMTQPSSFFLLPEEDTKTFAQYFINKASTSFICNALKRLHVTKVVCLGMPRLHEHIQMSMKSSEDTCMDSVLLDIDERYEMFWTPEHFIRFNMFNHFFFTLFGEDLWKKFLESKERGRVSIVVDPPFGGSVEAIIETLRWMVDVIAATSQKGETPVIFWLFPYFMEKRILNSFPSITMLDYQVAYDNHKRFKKIHCHSNASPVRIFCNVDNEMVALPEDHYRFCSICRRYVSKNNLHCRTCRTCPSKNGKTYVHCDWCQKCVKPGWKHCSKCGVCDHPKHICGFRAAKSCYLCGEEGHERRNCPRKSGDVIT